MNLDQLRSVQANEREKDSLQSLRPSFYQDVGDYIAELEQRRDEAAAAADNPFADPEVSALTDEIQTARDVVEAIYERRVGKIVKQASLAAAGLNASEEGLTEEERELFEDIVGSIEHNMEDVLGVLEGTSSPTPVEPPEEPDQSPPDPAEEKSPEETADDTDSDGSSASESAVDRLLVRVTKDVGSFVGVDEREYTLSTEDVVTLPAANAKPLLEREAAIALEEEP